MITLRMMDRRMMGLLFGICQTITNKKHLKNLLRPQGPRIVTRPCQFHTSLSCQCHKLTSSNQAQQLTSNLEIKTQSQLATIRQSHT